ncbi:MAG: ATPase [Erythrobacter sp.]|uniref:ATPase n=1 Tax=Erythrobacter sp. TaxID=1042 RepID=UPI002613FBFF|nr:ATPase [Erythrobacter sp.]MDJ0977802.1 ATPase [Erythrobacter sp.]
MTGKNHIIRAVGAKTTEVSAQGDELVLDETLEEIGEEEPVLLEAEAFEEAEAPRKDTLGLIASALALIAIAGWSGLYGWALQDQLGAAASAAPAEWVRWFIDWSVPVLLICMIWLLAMRNSTREANRFATSAAMLSHESAQLEERLSVVNRELSLAREFLASQSRDLEALGRIAAERLSTNAAELQDLIQTNGKQVETIGTASDTALANMTRLRDDLPVIANSARDVNNQVGNTGRTAREQLEKLVEGFERLNVFGTASETQVSALTSKIGKTIETFDAQLTRIEQTLASRFSSLQSQAEEYRGSITETETQALTDMNERITLLQSETRAIGAQMRKAEDEAKERLRESKDRMEHDVTDMISVLDGLDKQALEASQKRVKELHEEAERFDHRMQTRDARFFEEMARRQSEFDAREAEAAEALSQRLAALEDTLAEKRDAQLAETEKLVAHGDEMAKQLDTLSETIERVRELGVNTRTGLTEGMDDLGKRLEVKRALLIEAEANLSALTDASVRLLEIIQSGAKHSREDLPQAIDTASEHLTSLEERSARLGRTMIAMSEKSEDLSSYLIKTNEGLVQTDASIEALQARIADSSDEALAKLNGLRGALERLSQDSESFADETQNALIEALDKLEEATKATMATLDEGARTKVSALASELSHEAVAALEKSLRSDSAEAIGAMEQAAAHASGVGREATIQLRDQLGRVNDLISNLEQRVARARDLAEEQVNSDFTRRMALITDSLNSSAIDITGAMATEVSDTAWDSYLKGDRGIFTRRAVRLLDNNDAKGVAELYQSDETFKAHVNRYIHDFEAMLRAMLSTRDGNALSVTILGSDVGKLYVALAQSIERLRT